MRLDIAPVTNLDALEREWRATEAAAPDLSFFQSWTWIGCLAAERYADPMLIRAETEGRTVALALFDRRRGRLCLAESGDAALDAPFIEHNAPLLGPGAGPEVAAAILSAAWQVPGVRRLVISGAPPALVAAAGGVAFRHQTRMAPWVDLETLRRQGGDWTASLSANTRWQLRRTVRHYAEHGPLKAERAATAEMAEAWLEALVALHAARWQGRGEAGAFSTTYLQRFHRALVARAMARDELDLLRITAGGLVLGYLYNFRLRGQVLAYQSGFDFSGDTAHARPGLVCHALAIGRALAVGERVYDFLAPADRYKKSLSTGERPLAWVELARPWSLSGLAARLVGWACRGPALQAWPSQAGMSSSGETR